jgi:hypothetical protein
MITKTDWRAAGQHLMSDERRRLGDPPTAEEMLAYTRGELSAEDEERVRERLVCHPDLVRTLTEPFPSVGAKKGEPDFMSDEEFARHWASLRTRLRRDEPSHDWRFSLVLHALAAIIIVVFGALLWQARVELSRPQVIGEELVLYPDGRRGPSGEATTLTANGDSVLLVVPLTGQREFHRYRLELLDVASNRAVWTTTAPHPGERNSFVIVVPRRFLKPGTFRLVVYGLAGASEERVATYSLRVPR